MNSIKFDLYDELIKLISSDKNIDEISSILLFDKSFVKSSIKRLKINIIKELKEEYFYLVPIINKILNINKYYYINYKLLYMLDYPDEEILKKLNLNDKAFLMSLKSLYFSVYMYGNKNDRKYLKTIKDRINKYKYIENKKNSKAIIANHDKIVVNNNDILSTINSEYGNIYSFDKRKCIIISDTHFGSLFENMDYLKKVYEYASKNSIDSIIHTGDLIEGSFANYERCKKDFKDYNAQVEHVIRDYCYDEKIRNYILLGNHDLYPYLDYGANVSEILKERDDFEILGYKEAYLKLFSEYITLKHKVSKIKNVTSNAPTFLNFIGHSHQYRCTYDKNNIYVRVPTLSDVYSNRKYIINKGFLVSEIDGDSISLEYIDTHGKSLKLEKRIK